MKMFMEADIEDYGIDQELLKEMLERELAAKLPALMMELATGGRSFTKAFADPELIDITYNVTVNLADDSNTFIETAKRAEAAARKLAFALAC